MARTNILAALLMLCALITCLSSSARAQITRNIAVECDAFQQNANGSWTLNRETTIDEGIYGFILKPGIFRKDEKNVFGYDLVGLLEKDCAKGKPKKK
jgi:hypothetical protein